MGQKHASCLATTRAATPSKAASLVGMVRSSSMTGSGLGFAEGPRRANGDQRFHWNDAPHRVASSQKETSRVLQSATQ